MLLALRYYGRQMARLRRFTVPGTLLPALGNTCIYYVAPLFVAELVGRFARHGVPGVGAGLPYVLGFAGVLLGGEILWRIGIHCLNRLDGHGIENLYVIGMNELLAKDAAFFHDNFAGSLTKRVLSFAARFEEFADTLMFNVVGNLVPLAFASVVLWHYDPLLVAGLIGLIVVAGAFLVPLIRRRQRLVDEREEANALVSGRVADSIANMETIRAFAAEDREAAEHRVRVADLKHKSVRSWDYHNLRIDVLVSPPRQGHQPRIVLRPRNSSRRRVRRQAPQHLHDVPLPPQRLGHRGIRQPVQRAGRRQRNARPPHRAAAATRTSVDGPSGPRPRSAVSSRRQSRWNSTGRTARESPASPAPASSGAGEANARRRTPAVPGRPAQRACR